MFTEGKLSCFLDGPRDRRRALCLTDCFPDGAVRCSHSCRSAKSCTSRPDAQSLYAAAAACAASGLLCRRSGTPLGRCRGTARGVQLLLALAALFPLVCSLSRMSSFLRATVFTRVPLWVLCLALTLCALAHALSGLNVCAMWALPAVFLVGTVAVLSGLLTAGELRLSRLAAPTAALLPQFRSLLRLLLPGTLILALSLRDSSLAGAASRGLTAGGALLALLSLRTVLLLGTHTAALLPYPNFSAAGLAAIGDFARHGEVFFAVPLILCETGRCAALMSVILRVLPKRRR